MATYHSSYSNEYRLRLDITQGTQNVANNTSVVSWTLYLLSGNKSMSVYSTYSATVNGVTSPSTTQTNVTIGYNTSVTLGSGSTTVTHNADGTKSVPFSASFKTNSPVYSGGVLVSPGTMTISGSFALTTIPRYPALTSFGVNINDRNANLSWSAEKTVSQWRWSSNSGSTYSGWITVNASSGSIPAISVSPGSTYGFQIQVKDSASGLTGTSSVVSKTATRTPSTLTLSTTSQDIGSTITWTINESYDYTHRMTYYFGNARGYVLGNDASATNASTGTWTVPTALANQIPNATSGSGTMHLTTYHGNVVVGTKTYTFTATVPDNTTWQPSVPNVTISDAVLQPDGITSYVQGKSKANVVSSSTGQGGASIKNYLVTISGVGKYYGSNITSAYLPKSGTVTITVRATDSRGYYREKVSTITVLPYSPPKLTSYAALRNPNNQGTTLGTWINFSISSVNSQNWKRYRIRYRPTGGAWVELVNSTDYYTRSTAHSATDVLDVNSSYEVEFYIEDYYSSVTQVRNIGTAFQLMDFNASGRGVAFGKVSESNSFEVNMPTILYHYPMLRGLSSGIENTTYLQFMEIDGLTRQGWIGFGSQSHDNLSIHNNAGNRIDMNKDLYIDGNLTWHSGNSNVIEDSGSNTNGRYIRFSDGTQICLMTKVVDMNQPAWQYITFPASFVSEPPVSSSASYAQSSITGSDAAFYANVKNISLYYSGNNTASMLYTGTFQAVTGYAYIQAIGRWK